MILMKPIHRAFVGLTFSGGGGFLVRPASIGAIMGFDGLPLHPCVVNPQLMQLARELSEAMPMGSA